MSGCTITKLHYMERLTPDSLQMLVVEERVPNEDTVTHSRGFNVDEFIWPHGITPPLHWVRKRRFRKRLARSVCSSIIYVS